MRIDEQTAAKIKNAASVVDVLGDFIELHKKGVNYQALCPFHNDHHLGSFVINPRTNTWRCFSCGKGGNSIDFLMLHDHLSYPDALRWLGHKYSITIPGEDSQQSWQHLPRPAKAHKAPAKLPVVELPLSYVKARRDISQDTFCNWIKSLPWNSAQRERVGRVLNAYLVGHARSGHTIFWQLDREGHVRTGHMMRYNPDGHRNKTMRGSNSWVHYLLRNPGHGRAPLIADEDHADIDYQLFGMHLLDLVPHATINIVESEKTALLATICWGNQKSQLWMACNGLSWLSKERLQPLFNERRKIVLYPDRDAVAKWKEKARDIGYDRLSVNTTYIDRYWCKEIGEKADIGDIIIYSLTHTINPLEAAAPKSFKPSRSNKDIAAEVLARMTARNPNLKELVNRLHLEPITISYANN